MQGDEVAPRPTRQTLTVSRLTPQQLLAALRTEGDALAAAASADLGAEVATCAPRNPPPSNPGSGSVQLGGRSVVDRWTQVRI